MATPHKLTLIPYLQRWDHAARTLHVRVLVAPTGNPLAPLASGLPAFVDARLAFSASVSDAVNALPQRTNVDQTVVWPEPSAGTPTLHSPNARPMFTTIKEALPIPDGPAGDTFSPQGRDLGRQLRKYLPRSYRGSFAFVQPRTSLAVTDETYHCLMRCPPKAMPPRPPTVIGWGEALAFAMRRPRLAEALGLVHRVQIQLDVAPRLQSGGWLWIDLASSSDYAAAAAVPGFTRAFATRVPPLPNGERAVFTPVVFPVFADSAAASLAGNYDNVFTEAVRFDDGFSKIVHARQPLSSDTLDEKGTGLPIVRDEGVQLGWDDEDILEGQNRALGEPPDGEDPVLAPRGVLGYRVDVRPLGGATWTSLSRVRAPLDLGVDLGTAEEERWAEVTPAQHDDQLWLPAWFVKWRGGSLVIDTNDEQRLMEVPPGRPVAEVPLGADAVALQYGKRYEFRVRLADTTGGGPDTAASRQQPGESPIGMLHFKRRRRPGLVEIDPVTIASGGRLATMRVRRPKLGYPEAVFAAGSSARAALLAQIAVNDLDPPNAKPPGIRDPDTSYLSIRVLVRTPTFDPAGDEAGFVTWYSTTRSFPSDVETPLDLALTWVDCANLDDVDLSAQAGADGTVAGPLQVPTARDVRIEVRALGRGDLTYFADDDARQGATDSVNLHAVAATAAEVGLLATLPPSDALRSVFLRPDPIGARAAARSVVAQNDPTPVLLARLADASDLVADGSLLVGQPGERVAFGCAGLAHHLAPDSTSLELAEPGELAGQWIHVVQAVIDRDWTWRGPGSPTARVIRTVSFPALPSVVPVDTEVGTIELMPTINVQARKNPEREYTRLVFLDALRPPLGPDGLPFEVAIAYCVEVSLEGGGKVETRIDSVLPIVTPPRQVPRVVAAGLALTPYVHDEDYDRTAPRSKRLWLEFAAPLADPRDAYFVRALTRCPDPMLLPASEPLADPDVVETIPIDPELVRVITPGQVQDLAGLASVQKLEPAADSDRRFLVPLPPNTDPNSPELFSFFTYEVRVGHDRGPARDPLWSTAQGRFGEPLVLEGVHHPAPELACSATSGALGSVELRAPFATAYVGLRSVRVSPPNTELWFVLYARVMQADATTRRNIQIDLRRGVPLVRNDKKRKDSVARVPQGGTRWTRAEVEAALDAAGLPRNTPISALAVELLPEPNGAFGDPLGRQLGQVRILRTSPLAAVERDCCG